MRWDLKQEAAITLSADFILCYSRRSCFRQLFFQKYMKQVIPKLFCLPEHNKENIYFAPKHTRVQSSLALREKSSNSFHSINPLHKPLFKVQKTLHGDHDDPDKSTRDHNLTRENTIREGFHRVKTDCNVAVPLRNGRNLSITSGIITHQANHPVRQFLFPRREHNPQLVPDYRAEIATYLQTKTSASAYKLSAFTFQTEITEKMRSILLDWLVDVHHKFKLDQETLFITVSIIDRVLELIQIPKIKFQLYGVTALFIASKYEEVYSVPHVRDLVYVCDNAYTKEEILECEGKIIQALDFEILTTSPSRLLSLYQETAKLELKNYMLAKYMIELAILDHPMQQYSANQLASGAIYLVHKIRRIHPSWSQETMVSLTGLAESEIRGCAKELCNLLQNQDRKQFNASRKKFSQPNFMEVAKIRIEKKPSTNQ